MVILQLVIIGILNLQIYVDATSNKGKFESVVKKEGSKLDSELSSLQENNKNEDLTNGQRQKRFNEYYGYAFSSIRPLSYTSYSKGDQFHYTDVHSTVNPHSQTHRSLKEIVDFIKQPSQAPLRSPTQYPNIDPAIFKSHCICAPETNNTPIATMLENKATTNIHQNTFLDKKQETRHGYVNERGTNNNDEEDYSRPISFDPIMADNALIRPPPAVEHGSNQAGAQENAPTPTVGPPSNVGQLTTYPDVDRSPSMLDEILSKCDRVLLSCCHMLQVTYDCFQSQGCTERSLNGNPCEPKAILRVIERFKTFYVQ